MHAQDNMTEINKRPIFNENGDDSKLARSIFNGSTTGIANLNSVKYSWATTLYKHMINAYWIPEKVGLGEDKVKLKELSHDELEALKSTLSFLIFLDSLQVANLPLLSSYITAPEINSVLVVQAFFEQVHSQSYQYMLQELFPNLEREEIYNRWRNDPALLERNRYIADQYQLFSDNQTLENFKKVLLADYCLESIYFYSGFNYFFTLAARNKIPGCSGMIRYIRDDEHSHVVLFGHLIKEVFDKSDEDIKMIREALTSAAEKEILWGQNIYGDRILGISEKSTEIHIKYLTNLRGKHLGVGVIFPGYNTNPYAHLDSSSKENFFEAVVTNYVQSSAIDGWNDF